jgi:Fe-S-cluster containining protein
VFLSSGDLRLLAEGLKMEYTDIMEKWCRWVPRESGIPRKGSGRVFELSLAEKPNYDCVFWRDGCTVYAHRPLQCRTFPFWDRNLSPGVWEALDCPGAGKGELHGPAYIEDCLRRRRAEPVLAREA